MAKTRTFLVTIEEVFPVANRFTFGPGQSYVRKASPAAPAPGDSPVVKQDLTVSIETVDADDQGMTAHVAIPAHDVAAFNRPVNVIAVLASAPPAVIDTPKTFLDANPLQGTVAVPATPDAAVSVPVHIAGQIDFGVNHHLQIVLEWAD